MYFQGLAKKSLLHIGLRNEVNGKDFALTYSRAAPNSVRIGNCILVIAFPGFLGLLALVFGAETFLMAVIICTPFHLYMHMWLE